MRNLTTANSFEKMNRRKLTLEYCKVFKEMMFCIGFQYPGAFLDFSLIPVNHEG
jgi:hypothetical protein